MPQGLESIVSRIHIHFASSSVQAFGKPKSVEHDMVRDLIVFWYLKYCECLIMEHQWKIVALEEFFCPIPEFDLPEGSYELDKYHSTPKGNPDLLHQRVHNANIILITTYPLDATSLSAEVTPALRLIVVMSVGTDCVDTAACRKRGIRVLNCPGVNKEAVAQHAMTLYFASRRKLIQLHHATIQGRWLQQGTLIKTLDNQSGQAPLSWQDEVVGIFGYGAVGQQIASICSTLGMKVLIADRLRPSHTSTVDQQRTPFEEVLSRATVIFLCLPRNPDTLGLFSMAQFLKMQSSAILINVSRGGIVDETGLLEALRTGAIAGAATDVFANEPAGAENSVLLTALADNELSKTLPLIVSPHVAWCSKATTDGLQRMTRENVEGWLRNTSPAERIVV